MESIPPQLISLFLALIGCPIVFLITLLRARARGIYNAGFPLFLVFGTIGGMLLTYSLLPAPMGLACLIFMMTVAPISLLINSTALVPHRPRSGFHTFSMWFGFLYFTLFALGVVVAFATSGR